MSEDDWDRRRRSSVANNIAGIVKVYGRREDEKQLILAEFLREAAQQIIVRHMHEPEFDTAREGLIAAIEQLVDQMKEEDEAILEARSLSDGSAAGQIRPPRWLRAWPRPSGGSLVALAQRHMDVAEVRYADGNPEGLFAVLQIYIEEAGHRIWKLNHVVPPARRSVFASQMARLAESFEKPPTVGRDRDS